MIENIPLENRKLLALEAISRINNYMDCDVLGEAFRDIRDANSKEETINGMEYAISAINYRFHDRPECKQLYTENRILIENYIKELK